MSDQKKGTDTQQGQQGGRPPGPPKPEKVRVEVPVQVRPDKIVDYHLVIPSGSGLTESFVIAVIGEKGILPEQFTFHHPVGFTDLEVTDWVCTPTSDVHYLESAREDPREAQLALAETKVLLELASGGPKPIFKKDGNLHRYVDVPGQPARENVLADAESKLKAAVAILREAHDKAQLGKTTKAKHKHDLRRENFLEKEVLAAEEDLKKLRRDKREEIRSRVPRTYRTLGGPLHDRPQTRVSWIPQKATGLEARRLVYSRFALLAFEVKADPPAGAPYRDVAAQAELDDLRKKLAGAQAHAADLAEQLRGVRGELRDSNKHVLDLQHDQGLLRADLAQHKQLLENLETVMQSVVDDTADAVEAAGPEPVDAFAKIVGIVARLDFPTDGEPGEHSSSGSTPATGTQGEDTKTSAKPVSRFSRIRSTFMGTGPKPPTPPKRG